jgi:tetratricopeptide (TPR) repeat protein
VEGETFTAEAVAHVLGVDARAIVHELGNSAMQRTSLITGAGMQRYGGQPASSYRFRHILVQKRLYDGLDANERACLHGAVGDALADLYGEENDELALQLARHFQQAGATERAVASLLRAGDRATRVSAYTEAVAHYRRGLELLETLAESRQGQEREVALRLGLARALQATAGYSAPESAQEYERVRILSQQLGRTPALIEALMLLSTYHGTRGDYATALALGQEARDIAHRTGEPRLVAVTGAVQGWVNVSIGEYLQALEDEGAIVALCDTQEGTLLRDPAMGAWAVNALSWQALALAILGYPEQGRVRSRQCVALARRIGRTHDILHALSVACSVFHLSLREFDSALEWATEEVRLAVEKGDPSYQAMGSLHKGQAMSHLGRPQEGIALMQQTMRFAEMIGFRAYAPYYLSSLAEAYAAAGQLPEALDAAERGLALGLEMNEGMSIPDLYNVRGTLCLAADPPDVSGADADFTTAIDIARRQHARLLELRALVSLGQLWRSQGRASEARDLVQPVYAWFTEGFDLPDLVEARAFLQGV